MQFARLKKPFAEKIIFKNNYRQTNYYLFWRIFNWNIIRTRKVSRKETIVALLAGKFMKHAHSEPSYTFEVHA